MSDPVPAGLQAALAERYAIEREIGRGGMAIVYLARDLKHDRPVAIKVLLPDLASVLGPERFRREIHVASQLSHPHILAIYDSGEANGALYYAMPYIAGESLRARLDRERQLPVPEAMRIAAEVAAALDHAHRHGVVHRDIKPENILLGENGEAIVADFGIARAVSSVGDERLTKTGMTLGTPTYMSPEQATAERHIDGRTDIYALGCVLYEMLAGTPPFTGPNAQAVTARHLVDEAPSLTVVRRTVPPYLEQTIRVAMAKSPADRFATAAEFAQALGDATGGTLSRYSVAFAAAMHAPKRRWWGSPARAAAFALPAVLGMSLAGLFGWKALHQDQAVAHDNGALHLDRIGVLYFDDLSPDRQLDFFADALTELLIEQLERVEGITVVSANGVAPFRGSLARDSIADALGVGTLVVGGVEQRGDRIRVSLRLVDATGVETGDGESFEQPAGDLLAVRDTVANRAALLVRRRLGDRVRIAEARAGTQSVAAWTFVQRGLRAWKQADAALDHHDEAGAARRFAESDSLLLAAEQADARWVEPIIERAKLAYRRARVSDDRFDMQHWTSAGLEHAARAVALDGRSADALEIRGTLRYWRYLAHLEPEPGAAAQLLRDAEADLLEATRLAPRSATALYVLSHLYSQKPDFMQSFIMAERAYQADRFLERAPEILWRLYSTSYVMDQQVNAKSWCEEGKRRFPDNPRFVQCQLWLMTTRADSADPARARRLIGELQRVTPPSTWEYQRREAQMILAAVMTRAGSPDSARALLLGARATPQVDPTGELMYIEAFVRTLLGENDEALRLLQQYLVQNPEHREGLGKDAAWWWRDLRSDRRFQQLTGSGG